MAICVDEKIDTILKEIEKWTDFPRKAPIEGLLQNIRDDILPYSVFVDRWPNFETIITKPKDSVMQECPTYRLGIYSRNVQHLQSYLCSPGFLSPDKVIRIECLPMDLVSAIKQTANYLNMDVKILSESEPRAIAILPFNPNVLKYYSRKYGGQYHTAPLDAQKHTLQVAKAKWPYFSNYFKTMDEIVTHVEFYIKTQPNAGIFVSETNELVSWSLTNIDKACIMGHTVEGHRGKELSTWATGVNMKEHAEHRKDKTFWGQVLASNRNSLKSIMKSGGKVFQDPQLVNCVLRPQKSKL